MAPVPSLDAAGGDAILIAAQSGRALAAAARRAGMRPYVADLFADEDTLALSAGYRSLRGPHGERVERKAVLAALDSLARASGGPAGVVLGSGFEGAPDLVRAIGERHVVLGAGADVLARLKDPVRLTQLCAELGIPHPAIALKTVGDPDRWLVKRAGGWGGGHIRASDGAAPPPGFYHQQRVAGQPHSVAFLADGASCEILAVTEQWVAPAPRQPFRYGGAIEPGVLAGGVADAMAAAIAALVRATGLRGLASADMLVDGHAWWLIEINPRPGATLDVLDRRATPLLSRHIAASLGQLGAPEPPPAGAAGSAVLYATHAFSVPALAWPAFAADRPRAGQHVKAGDPICTVFGEAETPDAARDLLRTRSLALRERLASPRGRADRVPA